MKHLSLSVTCAAVALLATCGAFAQSTSVVTVEGEVVRYEPGKVLVIRKPDRSETQYVLSSSVAVPKDIQVGQEATVYLEPSPQGGTTVVRRVTTTKLKPSGQTERTVEETRTEPSGMTTTSTTTTLSGKVEAYTAGRSVTVLGADGSRTTYLIDSKSMVPEEVVVGKTITVVPVSPKEKVVRTITIRQ
jgi:hypothetical protein